VPSGVVEVAVVLTVPTWGCVVVGADVPDATGSLVVVPVAAAPCNVGLRGAAVGVVPSVLGSVSGSLLMRVCLCEPLDDDVDDGAIVDGGAVDVPEGSALSPADVCGVMDPLEMAGLGALGGEPGSDAKDKAISTTMPRADAVPIPFCRCRMFISHLNASGRVSASHAQARTFHDP
jgi:hypothetical protein